MTKGISVLGRLEWQAVVVVAVVFSTGAVVGIAVDRARASRQSMPRIDGPPGAPEVLGAPGPRGARGMSPPPGTPGPLPRYLEDLGLSYEQHEQIKSILDAQKPKVDRVMEVALPSLRAISDTTFVQIRAVLTTAQQSRFDRERPRRALAPGMPGGDRGGERGRGPPGPPPSSR